MTSQIAMIVGVVAAGLLVVGALLSARRITAEARREADRVAQGIVDDTRRGAEARAQTILAAAQEKALAGEEEADRRERDLDAREAQIDTRTRQRDNELAGIERQKKDTERRQSALTALEERGSRDASDGRKG